MAFEELDVTLVLLGFRSRFEGAEVSSPSGSGILLARIQAIPAVFQLPNHVWPACCLPSHPRFVERFPTSTPVMRVFDTVGDRQGGGVEATLR
jgi:hypothetical protein